MRTRREFYPEARLVCTCELENCLVCTGRIKVAYVSGKKTVQTLRGTFEMVHVPKRCLDADCAAYQANCQSSNWLQIAPRSCTYGYDVITQIGWLRQAGKEQFAAIEPAAWKLFKQLANAGFSVDEMDQRFFRCILSLDLGRGGRQGKNLIE